MEKSRGKKNKTKKKRIHKEKQQKTTQKKTKNIIKKCIEQTKAMQLKKICEILRCESN